jgi:hypothetical protein
LGPRQPGFPPSQQYKSFPSMPNVLNRLSIASRVAAGLLGGYAFVWGFTTLVIALALAGGSDYDEARQLANLIAFLVFLSVFLWAFASQRLLRVWVVLGGGGATMTLAAWMLTRSLA